jgi:hypothetical protein
VPTPPTIPSAAPTLSSQCRPECIKYVQYYYYYIHLLFFNIKNFRFLILDQFGDGWDTAKLYLYDSYGHYNSYAPNCTLGKRYIDYCFPSNAVNGDQLTAALLGFRPSYSWEIYWQAYFPNSGKVYTGGYYTRLTFTVQTLSDISSSSCYAVNITSTNNLKITNDTW